jgi:hypothetical protein
MLTLIRNGGVISMLFILLCGLVGLGAAFHFALKAQRTSLGFIRHLAIATLFATLAASCADEGATLYAAGHVLEKDPNDLATAVHYVIEGSAESTSPGILGFALLALTWMLVAVGKRRLDEREALKS